MEGLIKARCLLKELKDAPDVGVEMVPIDLSKTSTLVYANGSCENAAGHRTQPGYVVFEAEPVCVTAASDKANLFDWWPHRLRRGCHATLYIRGCDLEPVWCKRGHEGHD